MKDHDNNKVQHDVTTTPIAANPSFQLAKEDIEIMETIVT